MSKENDNIVVRYDLPKNWSEEKNFSFEHLRQLVEQVHNSAYSSSVKAINRFATIRNYIIGYYIVEYEQNGSDRAKYGDKLLKCLAEQINKRGINETLLKVSWAFYLNYPQVRLYLEGKSATPSHQLSDEKSATASHQFATPADKLISQLSFSHIREILTVDDPLVRFFYENLSKDLVAALNVKQGFSPTNLKYTKYFYNLYSPLSENRRQPADELVNANRQQPADDFELLFCIPWSHHQRIIDKAKGDTQKAMFFVRKTWENQWGRGMLVNFLDTDLYEREGKTLSNFSTALPSCITICRGDGK